MENFNENSFELPDELDENLEEEDVVPEEMDADDDGEYGEMIMPDEDYEEESELDEEELE